MKKITQCH